MDKYTAAAHDAECTLLPGYCSCTSVHPESQPMDKTKFGRPALVCLAAVSGRVPLLPRDIPVLVAKVGAVHGALWYSGRCRAWCVAQVTYSIAESCGG